MNRRILDDAGVRRTVGAAIRQRRSECGLSRDDLAHLSGLPPNTIGRIERGESDTSIVLLSYLYFHLQSAGVALEREGFIPVPNGDVSVALLPEIAVLRPSDMVRRMADSVHTRRLVFGMTLAQIASRAGVHPNSVWNFETALVCPSATTYFRVLRALEVRSVCISQGTPTLS